MFCSNVKHGQQANLSIVDLSSSGGKKKFARFSWLQIHMCKIIFRKEIGKIMIILSGYHKQNPQNKIKRRKNNFWKCVMKCCK